MTCQELVEFLFDYVNGDLPASVATSFQRHLEICADCRAYLSTYRQTIQLSKAAFEQPCESRLVGVPDELVHAILAARRGL
jgi:anti-sigma factor RsiW